MNTNTSFIFCFSDFSSSLKLSELTTSTKSTSVRILCGWRKTKFWNIFPTKLNSIRRWSSADIYVSSLLFVKKVWNSAKKTSFDSLIKKIKRTDKTSFVREQWFNLISALESPVLPIFLYFFCPCFSLQ